MIGKHLLTLLDLEREDLDCLLADAAAFKRQRGQADAAKPLRGKTVAMIFTKSSTRTRVSFEVGVYELGGNCLFLDPGALQVGRGESLGDTARVLSRYVHAAVIRCHKQAEIEEFARFADIPVINALTDLYHPCQLLADLQTVIEVTGKLDGATVAYVGDGASNMARSWAVAAVLGGINLRIGAPAAYQLDNAFVDGLQGSGSITQTADVCAAVDGADIIYTDVWVSMGFEEEAQARLDTLRPYQVNQALVDAAADGVRVMHCLPAYRGKEITSEVLDGPASIIWDQAENRIHAQKAVMARLIG